jgi:hypothetical protein
MTSSNPPEHFDAVQLAILALLVAIREEQGPESIEPKSEVLLAACGLSGPLIAQVLQKPLATIRKTLSRARSGGKKKS